MTQSIGIDYTPGRWQVCRSEQGQVAELHAFAQTDEMLAWVRHVCTQYPEPTLVVALDVATPFLALSTLGDERLEAIVQRYHPAPAFLEVSTALRTLRGLSARSYCAPSVEYLPTVPLARYLMRPALGSAREVCAIVALQAFMREQQASWEEMNFFCIDARENGTSVLVIVNGQIVNGIDPLQGSALPLAYTYLAELESGSMSEELQAALEGAFWEGLTQELSGLMAVHHLEDLVIYGQKSDLLVERLAETYQVYLFPHARTERAGSEVALGAALLAAGLDQESSASAVVERLQLREACQERLPLREA